MANILAIDDEIPILELIKNGLQKDVWVFEAYGGNMWCAFKLPDDAFFFCANRCRIDFWEEDGATYRSAPNMKEFAIANNLWNGEGYFRPYW